MPVTDTGFKRDEMDDLREMVNQFFIDQYGDGIDMQDNQTTGLLAGVLSKFWDMFESTAQGVFNALFILKCKGGNLDDRAAEEGINRNPETYAAVELQLTGYLQASIPAGTEFSTEAGQIFATDADVTITSQASTTTDGVAEPLTDDDGEPLGQITVGANALETGVDSNVMPGTIINSEESLDGFYGVTNPNGATGGAEAETDQELQLRVIANRTSKPNSTDNGIQTAIKNIAGVKDARLIDNKTMAVDSYGNPAKSVHLYVIGGDDVTIAQTYFDYLPPITDTVGKVSETVTDVGNKEVVINFDRAETVPVFVVIGLKVDGTSFDTDAGPDTIKQNIMSYFDTLTMGDGVPYSKMFGPAYSPAGVKDVTVALGTTTDATKEQDIAVTDFQLAVTSADNITVNVEEG
ncbi:baseplate J/gp47 family protein [Lactiplantibacillus daowaiensis]|uniref:Baseplate J/gp47 family protein n=1 Tax=Lactiplantibacillus daowaiensis TaxID=2559918 RepID=A0ABW1RY89_9LACO|nr:baseplate J/gp47 family protein [Lactiplantibacillus daowaiensis]